MTSPFKTGRKSEALDALPEVLDLAKELLSAEKFLEAEDVASNILFGGRPRFVALARLKLQIGNRPTRPLWYLWSELDGLPSNTRDCIRYLGDYIDLLTKEMAYEYLGGGSRKTSLGVNAKKLQTIRELAILAGQLYRYNDFLYQPGKHDFSLPLGRSHRFTLREVVLTTYITKILGEKILIHSNQAKIAVEKDNLYMIGGKWGSNARVEYAGDRP